MYKIIYLVYKGLTINYRYFKIKWKIKVKEKENKSRKEYNK